LVPIGQAWQTLTVSAVEVYPGPAW